MGVAPLGVAALGVAASAASAATFSNTTGITINSGSEPCFGTVTTQPAKADPYPSAITVSGLGSSISDVNVTISGLSHTFVEDVGLLLVSPAGQSTILMTDSGGEGGVSGINLTFDDAATAAIPDSDQLTSGTYKPGQGTTVAGSANCSAPESFPKDDTGTDPWRWKSGPERAKGFSDRADRIIEGL